MAARTSLLFSLIMMLLAGAGAGVVASVLTLESIETYAANLLAEHRFSALTPRPAITLPGTYEEALEVIGERADATSVAFFVLPRPLGESAPWQSLSEYEKGRGVMMSADGWVLVSHDLGALLQKSLSTLVLAGHDGQTYDIDRIVLSDGAIAMIKLKDAQGLNVASFEKSDDLRDGALVFGASGYEVVTTTLLDADALVGAPAVTTAEAATTSWKLTDNVPAGLVLWNAAGNIVGLSEGEGSAASLTTSERFVDEVLRARASTAAGLGAYTLDIAHVYNLAPELAQDRRAGALLMPQVTGGRAVLVGSPAAEAGLLARDLIVAVDGVPLSESVQLFELLADYAPGDTANLDIVRSGEAMSLPVHLTDLVGLVY